MFGKKRRVVGRWAEAAFERCPEWVFAILVIGAFYVIVWLVSWHFVFQFINFLRL